ncbi:hypothetical protein WR25_25529 [Diploscapter pachys]|uniref:Cystatin domain-containing protein n=1 Tax=Diploscapter pachys TaxID=2018661 RepID=A0A2A2JFM6_9BILA|nr:hypothetical protein WR25_25529 [Diploscapter pachys]
MHLYNSFLIAICLSTVTGSEEDDIEIDSIYADGSMNLHGKTVERVVWKAFVDEINDRMRKIEVWWIPLRILDGSYEIVAGIQYDLQVLGGESNCPKEGFERKEVNKYNCAFSNKGKRAIFHILAYEMNLNWKGSKMFRSFSTIERNLTSWEVI